MPLLGGALQVAGAAIKGMVNRARAKRAQKKEAKAAQKVAEANSLLANKLGLSSGTVSGGLASGAGLMDEKIISVVKSDARKNTIMEWIKNNVVLFVGGLITIVAVVFLFKSKRKRK